MAHDVTPHGNILEDGEATWLSNDVTQDDRVDNPIQVPHPTPADSRERETAKATNTRNRALARIAGWLGGTRLGGVVGTVIRVAGGIAIGDGPTLTSGTGNPEGVVIAPTGSLFFRTDGAAGEALYSKDTGAGSAGWVLISSPQAATVSSADVTKAVGAVGVSLKYAREDHGHDITTAAPVTVGSANAEGGGTTISRAAHVHRFEAPVKENGTPFLGRHFINFVDGGDVAWTVADDGGNDGVNVSAVVSHTSILTATAPEDVSVQGASAGVTGQAARRDHLHNLLTATAVDLDASSTSTEGSGAAAARANHTHAIAGLDTWTAQPGIILDGAQFLVDFNNQNSWAPNQAATMIDLINGAVGTVGATSIVDGHLHFAGGPADDYVDFGAIDVLAEDNFAGGGGIDFYLRIDSDGELNIGTILDTTDGTSTEGYIIWTHSEASGAVKIGFQHNFSGTKGVWSTTAAAFVVGVWYHVAIAYDSDSTANNATFRVNSESEAVVRSSTPTGTAGSNSGNSLRIGNRVSPIAAFHGDIEYLAIRDATVADAANRNTYSTIRPRLHADGATAVGTNSANAGSTNTRIRRFANRSVTGGGLTWTDSATEGSYVTCDNDALVAITFTFLSQGSSGVEAGVIGGNFASALNNTFDTTAVRGKQETDITVDIAATSTWIGKVSAGDKIWASTEVASATGGTSTSDYRMDVAVIMEY